MQCFTVILQSALRGDAWFHVDVWRDAETEKTASVDLRFFALHCAAFSCNYSK